MKSKWPLILLLLAGAAVALLFRFDQPSTSGLGKAAQVLTDEILSFGPRPPESEALSNVKSHLREKLQTAGWEVVLQEFERDTPAGKKTFSNLRARLNKPGSMTWERQVEGILCAHIDSKSFTDRTFLGADDAASACAAVVEIAKHLAIENPYQAEKLELVLFDGEEAFADDMTILDGLYGSRHYANTWRSREDKPVFGILLDMVGHKGLSIRIPSDSPKHLSDLMFDSAEKMGEKSRFGTAPGPIMDDHLPLNLVGIPTLDIIGDFANKPWWHTSGDNASIISAESLEISMNVVLHMLDELLKD